MKKIIKIFLFLFLFLIAISIFLLKTNNIGKIKQFLYSKKFDSKNQIVFWSIQLKPIYEVQMNEIIKEFEKKNPNYKIKWIDIPIQEAQKRTLASILSSTPPDLINLNPNFSLLLAQKDTLYYFNDDDVSQFNSSLVDKLMYKGKIYALPFYATSAVTIYNKEKYKECFSENGNQFNIVSYNDLFNISNNLSKNKTNACSNAALYVNSLNENDTLAKILGKYDVVNLDTQEEKQKAVWVISQFDKLYKKEQMPKDTLTLNHRECIERYMSNQAMIIVAGANFIDMIKKSAPDVYRNSQITNQLIGENGEYDISLMNLIIPKHAKNKELALEFALLLTNKQNQLELAKLTNVLPANKYALDDNYFKNCSNDLYDKSRCISTEQLDNISTRNYSEKNQSTINETINKTFEQILLDKNSNKQTIEQKINNLAAELKLLREN